jgi:hypothetical protein
MVAMPASTGYLARRLGITLLAACAVACGGSPTAPRPAAVDVDGTWTSADRSFRWVLTATGTTVTGLHVPTDGLPAAPFTGELTGDTVSFSVVTGEYLSPAVDPPQRTNIGWRAQVEVDGNRMTGTISTFGTQNQPYVTPVSLQRIHTAR